MHLETERGNGHKAHIRSQLRERSPHQRNLLTAHDPHFIQGERG